MDKVIQTLLKNYPQSKNVLWITLVFPSYISIRQELQYQKITLIARTYQIYPQNCPDVKNGCPQPVNLCITCV